MPRTPEAREWFALPPESRYFTDISSYQYKDPFGLLEMEPSGALKYEWWAMRDLNPRPSPCKGAALPLRQSPVHLVPPGEFESPFPV